MSKKYCWVAIIIPNSISVQFNCIRTAVKMRYSFFLLYHGNQIGGRAHWTLIDMALRCCPCLSIHPVGTSCSVESFLNKDYRWHYNIWNKKKMVYERHHSPSVVIQTHRWARYPFSQARNTGVFFTTHKPQSFHFEISIFRSFFVEHRLEWEHNRGFFNGSHTSLGMCNPLPFAISHVVRIVKRIQEVMFFTFSPSQLAPNTFSQILPLAQNKSLCPKREMFVWFEWILGK